MEIYDVNGNRIEGEPDLSRGWLRNATKVVHHDAVEGVPEQGHYETIAEYPNGGKDVEWIVDVPGIEARPAWDEEVLIQIYELYDPEMEEHTEPDGPSVREQLEQRIAQLEETNAMLTECLMEMSEIVYQ